MKTSTIASHYVRCAIAGAVARGLDADTLLAKAGIGSEILHEPKARVFPDKMAKLLRVLVVELNDEFLGLDDKPSPRGSFETLCQLIVPCSTLGEAFKLGSQFYHLFDMALHTEFVRTDKGGILRVNENRPCLNPNHYLTEFQLVLWHRLACWLTGKRIPIELAEFAYAKPNHADEYRLFFYGERLFQRSQTALHITQHYLDLPIIRSRDELPELLKEAPYVFLVKPNNTASINAQIRRILETSLEPDMPDFESVAYKLNTSSQTLRRRLKEENTSFQAIKDQVRRDIAIYYLGDPQHSINDIALKVGFTEPSTFHRAFKKWTGVTPGDYRTDQTTQSEQNK
ncbi:AraC family transcriptional regulator [Bermanella sp. R86510]|uniref:AraC family transcriptional regulator n=1 Tax=unclassified Bermanella TaxID=2627862 RepID=UPI0037C573A7